MSDLNWREGARIVEAEWEKEKQQWAATSAKFSRALEKMKFSWLGAAFIWAGLDRNPKPLIELLRSDVPITQQDRENLAQAIEMAELAPVRKRRGRPKNSDMSEVAAYARMIFRQWRNENDKRKIKDYGHRSEMMDISIEMAKKFTRHGADIDAEAIREYLQRPTYRQK